MMQPAHAVVLGIVEGLTEFLPVSSTGHLILASHVLGLRGEAVKSFEIVIQAGALVAVAWLYRHRLTNLRLGRNLLLSFLPAAASGWLLHRPIKALLFNPTMVAAALAAGGGLMLAVDRRSRGPAGRGVDTLTAWEAALIGFWQCLSLWPGMSRTMVTIVGGLLVGLSPAAAAEYSFLLALPTLGLATLYEAALGGRALLQDIGAASIAAGFAVTVVVAAAAIRGFLRYLTHGGLAPFGWYRLALAGTVWWLLRPT